MRCSVTGRVAPDVSKDVYAFVSSSFLTLMSKTQRSLKMSVCIRPVIQYNLTWRCCGRSLPCEEDSWNSSWKNEEKAVRNDWAKPDVAWQGCQTHRSSVLGLRKNVLNAFLRLQSSGMWRRLDWYLVAAVWKNLAAYVSRANLQAHNCYCYYHYNIDLFWT
jgi:hypothetical protein